MLFGVRCSQFVQGLLRQGSKQQATHFSLISHPMKIRTATAAMIQ